jgi:hypothetical protein
MAPDYHLWKQASAPGSKSFYVDFDNRPRQSELVGQIMG